MINLDLIFVYGVRSESKLILLYVDIHCSSNICWKTYSFTVELSWNLCWNQLAIYVRVYFRLSIPFHLIVCVNTHSYQCLNYSSFVVSFKIRKCESSKFFVPRSFWQFQVLCVYISTLGPAFSFGAGGEPEGIIIGLHRTHRSIWGVLSS